ncbi:hypothetical protein M5D96_002776 [Drosophila gunungcola]|uniref:Uncharacterized protein n=1 Tax=Drosophila gunungcola TaxID=103775 RepID=A0A9Q0BWM9_9MUSC|nr:hypothetical protein M5D96_002776 [Drosophila gunungcola]
MKITPILYCVSGMPVCMEWLHYYRSAMGSNRTLNGIQIMPPYLFMKLTRDYRCSGNRNSDRNKDSLIACVLPHE